MGRRLLTASLLCYVGCLFVGGVAFCLTEGWRLLDAVYFSAITMKTIGFGDFVPSSMPGRIFNSIFALVAPGITVFTITQFTLWYLAFIQNYLRLRDARLKRRHGRKASSLTSAFVANRSTLGVILLIFYLIAGSLTFCAVEGLDVVQAWSLVLSAFTTIGYGDVVPKTDAGKIWIVCYAFLGNGVTAVVGEVIGNAIAQYAGDDDDGPKTA